MRKYCEEMKCDYNPCTIKACIPSYNSSKKREKIHILSKLGCPHQRNQVWRHSYVFPYLVCKNDREES